jgi:hypothetical protein
MVLVAAVQYDHSSSSSSSTVVVEYDDSSRSITSNVYKYAETLLSTTMPKLVAA